MRFTKFVIHNFKGIKHAELNLNQYGQGKVFTLVGLNESGKTTILEAINSFSPDLSTEQIFQNDIFRRVEKKDLVPKHQKDNFTGEVKIEAHLEYSNEDRELIKKYFKREHGFLLNLDKLKTILIVTKHFTFKNSDYIEQGSWWAINLFVKTTRQKNFRELSSSDDVWQASVQYIRSMIPSICYFPTFLFEFPERVYLSHTPEQYEPQNEYYKQIIQDVLDSLDRGLTIEEHIVERVGKIEGGEAWNIFKFFQSDRKEQIDAVMNHLGSQITKSVFMRWNEIFGSNFRKNIKIEWSVDGEQQDPPIYLSFSVQDGTSIYSIAERSLGFRWFFCFLLFTQFRTSRRGSGTLFLLDEPASNLHATAQHQLLESFGAVTEGNNSLIYSTHSHYMINPQWLEGAFIVQNGAIEYDEELQDMQEYHFHETSIKVTSYRRFVGESPNKATYYQPILDALDYTPNVLEHHTNTVMVEGKGDFYVFTYFKEVILENESNVQFLPSSGAGGLGPLISLYLGWGYKFKILLDDDFAGVKARKRYIKEWYLDDTVVETLGTIESNLSNKKLEDMITSDGIDIIKESLGVDKVSKTQLVRFFQDKFARKEKISFDDGTKENFSSVITALSNHFENSSA